MSVEVRAMTTPSTLMRAGSLTHVKFPGTSYGGVGYTNWEDKSRLDDTRIMWVPVLEKKLQGAADRNCLLSQVRHPTSAKGLPEVFKLFKYLLHRTYHLEDILITVPYNNRKT